MDVQQFETYDAIGRVLGALGGAAIIAYCVHMLRVDRHEWRAIVPVMLFGANLCAFYVVGMFVSTLPQNDYPTYVLLWWSRWLHLHALIICFMFLCIIKVSNGNGEGEA